MADITDFQIGQGETFQALIQLLNRSDNNAPIDIEYYNFYGQIRENYTTDEIAAEFSFEKLPPYTSGSLYMKLPQTTTTTLTQRKYVYDVFFNSGSGESVARRILEGGFTVRPAVTR